MLRLNGSKKRVGLVNQRLANVEKRLNLLFSGEIPDNIPTMSNKELMMRLIAGNGIYWNFDGEKIIPLAANEVIKNLKPENDDEELEDAFYDFDNLRGLG